MVNVDIYTIANCPYCDRAKALLDHKSVPYTAIRADLAPEKFDELQARAEGVRTFPQIFIGDVHVGGFDQLWALEQSGELDQLLQADL